MSKLCSKSSSRQCRSCGPRLLALIGDGEISHLEWLGAVPSSKATKGLEEQTDKVSFLKELGAAPAILTGRVAARASSCELGLDVGRRL